VNSVIRSLGEIDRPPGNFVGKAVTAKQRRFIAEYIVDLSGVGAYKRAGYKARGASARANASRLLANANIRQAIDAAQAARAERTRIDADDVVRRLDRESTATRPGSSHSARVRALELLGKHLGLFTMLEPLDILLNRLPPDLAEPLRAALGRALSTQAAAAPAEPSV
jgi:hypothetical protein